MNSCSSKQYKNYTDTAICLVAYFININFYGIEIGKIMILIIVLLMATEN